MKGRGGALVLAALLAVAPPAAAAIRHQQDFNEGGSDRSQLFFSTTVAPEQDRFLLLSVTTMGSNARVVSASYGDGALSSFGEAVSPAGNCRIEWWGLVAPAEGANMLRLALAATTANLGVTVITYAGVDQLTPTAAFVPASGLAGPISVTVPSAPDQIVLDGVCGWAADADIARAGPGQSPRWHWTFGPHHSAGSQKPGAASVTLQWTAEGTGALEWAAAGLALRPASDALPPVKLAVDTAGCAVAGAQKAGSRGVPVPILLLALAAFSALATRRFRGARRRG